MDTELQPDVDEVLQTEEPYDDTHAVDVVVCGPVRNQPLPTKGAVAFTKTVGSTTATKLLGADHRRKQAIIACQDNLWIGFTKNAVEQALATPTSNGAYKSLGSLAPPITIGATVEIWVAAVSTTALVSVLTELWATGEGPA